MSNLSEGGILRTLELGVSEVLNSTNYCAVVKCKQQTCELTEASISRSPIVMYNGVLTEVMQVSRAFNAAASCGCCDGFNKLWTAGSGDRTVYITRESWLETKEKKSFVIISNLLLKSIYHVNPF